MEKNKVLDPLNDYQLLQETSGGSYFFANVDTIGVEGTSTLENTAKPYIVNEETGEFVNVEEDDADADMAEDAFDIDEE